MGILTIDQVFTRLDLIALGYFVAVMLIYRVVAGPKGYNERSLVGAIQRQRVAWMHNMSLRGDHRTMDVILLNNLAQGNAFFASTTAIAIGGMAAVMGSGEKAQAVLDRLPYVQPSNPILWEVKLFVIMAIFIFAFFKFAWAFRLGHYTAIMIGATPLLPAAGASAEQASVCREHAVRTAKVAGLAADHGNGGLRSFYYAIAAMAWFFHPLFFIAATTWVLAILVRRDFFSRSRRLIAGD